MLKKKWLIGAVLGLVIIGLVLANMMNMQQAAAVQLIEVTEGTITEQIYTNGKLEAIKTTDVYASSSGVAASVNIKPGDAVVQGQALLTLKMDNIQEQLEKERLNLQLTEAQRLQAKKQHFEQYKKMMVEDPSQEAEELDLTAYDLQIQSSELTIASLEKQLSNSTVYATEAGTVTEVNVHEGQLVTEGSPIVTISDFSSFKVVAYLNELDAGKAALGMKATVSGESISATYDGEVTYLAPTAENIDPASKDAVVEMAIGLLKTDDELRAGYNVSVEIEIPDKPRLLVPIRAVQYDGEQAYVFKVSEGTAVKVPVTTGKEGEDQLELVTGVVLGEPIIAEGPDSLRDGDKVSVK